MQEFKQNFFNLSYFKYFSDRKSMNLIKNLDDFACQKMLVREADAQLWNFGDNLSVTLINHCFHEIQHIKNTKIRGIGLIRDNVFAFRIDFCMS